MDAKQYAGSENKWLKAADLKDKEFTVDIDGAQEVSFPDGTTKLAIRFAGREKGMVLNVTNTQRLIDAFDAETDRWFGKQIVLYSERVQFGTQMVDAIRLRVPQPSASEDDDIPF